MPSDPFYRTAQWRKLRVAVLQRDGYRCVVPACEHRAVVVDHIISPKNGGAHVMWNLRSLCRDHDNQMKELKGKRRREIPFVKGSKADGTPNDPNHHWVRIHQC